MMGISSLSNKEEIMPMNFKLRNTQWAPWIVSFLALASLSPSAHAQFGSLKKYADKAQKIHEAFKPMPVEEEVALGREVSAKIVAGLHIYKNDPLTRYVNEVGATVAAQSERKDIQYHFAVLDSDEINAFSTPGGFVFITRAALKLCQDESELAGVLAHEVGHITGKYIVHTIEHDKEKSAGISEASNYVPGSPYLQGLAKNVLTNIFTGGLPPQDEFEADLHGTQYAHDAGYPADGLERFLGQLEVATTQEGAQTTITSTHPPAKDRIARIQQFIAKQQWQDTGRPKLDDRYSTLTAMLRK